ncbi:anhydro-N-acetylmuramic acid kinase [Flavobacterium akiainvivens]|uniref:Anhydro-N-acetylmuramic acid kinase n=1 Tax=Flavobacterium akiainvivens TaxID=1202724 RepID=A0A0M8MCX5_9FLAO|nr:anhydro-N-acetylmuramic acid kinase [Flavobacterium akiainvivens]KOS07555.1 anhydro-N-acetylmuramic acid kinase [Flavobacterium akiainvivens]SFQ77863.1 anhydro-N-acetylmuramic acid kinase [Flavobacterium akiainvivens]
MANNNYNVLGVMSGTSLDGVDLAHIHFTETNGKWTYIIGEAETVPYTDAWVQKLKEAIDYTPRQLEQLDHDYTALLANIIREFIAKYNLEGLDAVCSHGHTILHRPHEGVTLQIGNLPQIAALTGQNVVCDFRVQDVALGGQGAPLVPIGDRILFANYDYCLNLGGFANISFEENGSRLAFDICPVNTVLNYYANRLGYPYDNGGQIAEGGQMQQELFYELESLDFYTAPYPKSLGFEFVKGTVLPLIENYNVQTEDKLHTFTNHIASQVAQVLAHKQNGRLLVTGGGAYNTYLIKCMQALMPDMHIAVPDDKAIQFKEALIFALLGVLRLRGDINVLHSVTGAAMDHSSGKVYKVQALA